MMNFPYLLFDADDTLFDFPKASRRAFEHMCRKQDIPLTPGLYERYQAINQALWVAFDRGEVSQEEIVRLRFVRLFDFLGLQRDIAACNRDYLSALGEVVYPTPYAEEVCAVLSPTHRLYLVTNAIASVQRSRLRGSVFAPYITAAFISEEAGCAKPSAAYFDYVLRQIPNAAREDCLLIGDSLTADIQGANNAGIACCWYNPKRLPRPESLRIDWEITDLRELYTIVD
jgi:2-haloacid dehalogenase